MHGAGQVGRVLPPGGNRAHWLTWNRAHFGAWCIVSAPLILGLELNDSSLEPILDIIGNNEAIAVDQAFVGHPGRLVSELPVPPSNPTSSHQPQPAPNQRQLWAKPVAKDGAVAVLLINASPHPMVDGAYKLEFALLNMSATTSATVRDIWARKDLGSFTQAYSTPAIAPFDSMFVRITTQQGMK
jgi:alpha-galactosidase